MKPVPVMVTLVPPLVVPLAGETPVTETEDDDGGGVMVPVPLRAMSCGRREEPRSMRKSAVRDPGANGVNATVIVQVCACGTRRWQAGGCAAGWTAWLPRRAPVRVGVRIEKSCRLGPLMLTRVIVAGELPLLVMVKDLVMLALTRAAGKTRADGWKDTSAVGLPFGPLCPWLSTAPATLAPASTTAAATPMAAALRRNRDAFLGAGCSCCSCCSCLFRLPGRTSACFAPCPPTPGGRSGGRARERAARRERPSGRKGPGALVCRDADSTRRREGRAR